MSRKYANTVKDETIVFIFLALLVPLWPISMPIFLWLAYRSYKKGDPERMIVALEDVQKAKELLDAGAITQSEFANLKSKALEKRA